MRPVPPYATIRASPNALDKVLCRGSGTASVSADPMEEREKVELNLKGSSNEIIV